MYHFFLKLSSTDISKIRSLLVGDDDQAPGDESQLPMGYCTDLQRDPAKPD